MLNRNDYLITQIKMLIMKPGHDKFFDNRISLITLLRNIFMENYTDDEFISAYYNYINSVIPIFEIHLIKNLA